MSPHVSCAQTLICSQAPAGRVRVGMGQNCARIHAQKWPALSSIPYGSIQEGFMSPVGQQPQPQKTPVGGKGPWGASRMHTTQSQGPASPWATSNSSVHTGQRP